MHVSRICSDLVRINSENPPGTTAGVIEYIRTFLEGLGIRSRVVENAQGMSNLVTRKADTRLMLCGHVDVVPARDAAWSYPPFSGIIDDQFVHGRGSTDMKGGCASILSACETLVNTGRDLPATLIFVCDEETGGEHGIRRVLAENLIRPQDCLIAEPSPCRHPVIGQKGLCRLELEFSGVPAHGSLYPEVGVSAIVEAMSFLGYVQGLYGHDYPGTPDLEEIITRSAEVLGQEFSLPGVRNILRRLMFNPGTIHGGEKSNVVAEHCTLELEIRIPWGCSIPDLLSDISAHAGKGSIVAQESHAPSITDPSCPLVTMICEEIRTVYGGPVFPIVQWAASDARHLRSLGFNVIEYGPGEISRLHAVNERVTIDSLEKSSRIYLGVLGRYAEAAGNIQ